MAGGMGMGLITAAYTSGLALLAIVMLVRGRRKDEVEGTAFPSILQSMSNGEFSASMRANPNRVN
jgi:hypothetical protein